MVGARGFEPPTSSSRTMRATKLRHAPTERPLKGPPMITHRMGPAESGGCGSRPSAMLACQTKVLTVTGRILEPEAKIRPDRGLWRRSTGRIAACQAKRRPCDSETLASETTRRRDMPAAHAGRASRRRGASGAGQDPGQHSSPSWAPMGSTASPRHRGAPTSPSGGAGRFTLPAPGGWHPAYRGRDADETDECRTCECNSVTFRCQGEPLQVSRPRGSGRAPSP
jgi:hypothetical protein